MPKKSYVPPTVKKVELVYKNAILGVCHSSPNLFPAVLKPTGGWESPCFSESLGCPQQTGG